MRVLSIELRSFRNYEHAVCEFNPGINVITGANAQGKTNLLEAVYMLTGGRSFRTRTDSEIIAFGADGASVSAQIEAGGRTQSVELRMQRGRRKTILQNGVRKRGSELSDCLRAVLFCPGDLGLIRDGAASRRRLMDFAISQLRPGYSTLLAEFSRLNEHKAYILRKRHERRDLLATLEDFNVGIVRATVELIRYRAAFTERLRESAAAIHRDFSGQNEELSIEYKTLSSVTEPLGSRSQIAAEVESYLAEHQAEELQSGRCLTGAHRDDLLISIDGSLARTFASQGQTRTAALSIKLAEREIFLRELGEHPILLLDDVLSELDSRRREFVLERIGDGQTLITCCEDELIRERTGILTVTNGQIKTEGA